MKFFKHFLIVILLTVSGSLFAQYSYNTYVAQLMNLVNTDSVWLFERQLTGDTTCVIGGTVYTISSRYSSNAGNNLAAQYIMQKFQSFGLTSRFQNITSTRVNVLATKTGTKYPNQYFVICAHYDDMPSSGLAPGADDNCSGTIAVIEAARILANINFPYTILFAAWDDEELGLYGSKAYADTAYFRGDSIKGVLNFDMIAYDGNNDGALDVNTNAASTPLANEFAQLVTLYQPTLVPQVTTSLNGGSDHQSFQQRGYSAILSIEDNSDFTPYYHTSNDKVQTLNKPFFIKMIKAGVAALVSMAGDYKITITHNPITTGPGTTTRIATAVIKSSQKIATGSYQPRLYYKINNGSFAYVNPSYTNLDTFKFNIPGQSLGTNVKYYIAAQDSAGTIISTSPTGGSGVNPPGTTPPATLYEYNVANIYISNVGNGTNSSNYPYTTYYEDGRTDMLYTSSEILSGGGQAGSITKIGFNVISADPIVMNDFAVKIQTTTATTLSGFVSSGWTTVYSGTYSVPGTGWQYINLQTPFSWNGTSNLLVEICYHNTNWTAYSPVYASPAPNMTWGYYVDNSNGCTLTGGATQANRPNISFYIDVSNGIGNNPNTPLTYSLSQNFPNPFNPTTKISYSIPKQEFVTLKIYDMLGREVAVLVNETKGQGFYTVEFNAENLSSGIYTYRISAGTYENVMKMIYLK